MQTTDQSENIIENGGYSISLVAYKEWSERQNKINSTRRHLDNEPILNLTAKQLFFFSFAQKYGESLDMLQ